MIELAFYKGTSKSSISGFIFTALIKMWTQCKYSHTEIVVKPSDDPNTWVWSSSSSGEGGVRARTIDYKPENWVFVKLPTFNELDTLAFIQEQIGKKYDWAGILLSQILDIPVDNRDKWFCSELCYAALIVGGLYTDNIVNPATVSPKIMWNMVDKDV